MKDHQDHLIQENQLRIGEKQIIIILSIKVIHEVINKQEDIIPIHIQDRHKRVIIRTGIKEEVIIPVLKVDIIQIGDVTVLKDLDIQDINKLTN